MATASTARKPAAPFAKSAAARCLCRKVALKISVPARWAWHDHSENSRRAHGAAYATYVGCYRSRVRVAKGAKSISRFEDESGYARSFCTHCGTPLIYERPRAPEMVNIPRALFDTRTGREPLYHVAIEQRQEWTYMGEPLAPLKGFPGVVWTKSRKKKPRDSEGPL